MKINLFSSLFVIASFVAAIPAEEKPENPLATRPGELRSYATCNSIGLEWDIAGDTNHNAVCAVQFHRKGETAWQKAMPLFRVDYQWHYSKERGAPINQVAGSIMFLSPGTTYAVRLDLADPDGGQAAREFLITTRRIPRLPTDGRTFHVVPGKGGGSGTGQDPFQGIAAAEAGARPGDVFLLHKGEYGCVTLARAGDEVRHIVWKAVGDGAAVFNTVELAGSYIWIEGLSVKRTEWPDGIDTKGPVVGAVVTRNTVTGFHNCILLNRECADWYIADNVISGDKTWAGELTDKNTLSGEGIELGESKGGHTVCYNRISLVADGISYPGRNTDIFGNDIFDVTDEGLEPDRGWANVRMWGNRISRFGNSALSFQPMKGAPWYFIRNQIVGARWTGREIREPEIFKFRVQDRFAFVNNTIVCPSHPDVYMDCLFTALCRNNLFVSSTGKKPLWIAFRYPKGDTNSVLPLQKPGWKTDVDYNGYDWGADCPSWKEPAFRYDEPPGGYFTNLESFASATGVETHGRRVRKEEIFENWSITGTVDEEVPPLFLTLKKDGAAVDAGASVPNLAEKFEGRAPDLGAYELGRPLPHYGPRDEKATAPGLDWRWY